MTSLNLAKQTGETPAAGDATRYPDPTPPEIILMMDIETLDLGPRPIITQVAVYALDLGEDEVLERSHYQYYPIQPQLELPQPRTFSADTLIWWMSQGDDARSKFKLSSSQDFEELPALLRHLVSTFNNLTAGGTRPYELWARGPQFDVVAVETLMKDCGIEVPWSYDSIRDLRTLLALAGVNPKNIPDPSGFIKHAANWDVKAQIGHYREAIKALRTGR